MKKGYYMISKENDKLHPDGTWKNKFTGAAKFKTMREGKLAAKLAGRPTASPVEVV